GPLFWVISLFCSYLSECEALSQRAANGAAQLTLPNSPREMIVSVTADIRREILAMNLLKDRGSPLLYIAGQEPGLDLVATIKHVWGGSADIATIQRSIIWNQSPPTTLATAQAVNRDVQQHGFNRVIVVMSDIYLPRTIRQYEYVLPKG